MALSIKKEMKARNAHRLGEGYLPPQATELEEAVLGVLMLEKYRIETVILILPDEEMFYSDAHQKIYSAIKTLYTSGSPIDLLTVTEQLRKQGEIEIIGGAYFLTKLTMNVVTGANVETHAMIVKDRFIKRQIIKICGQAIGQAYDPSTEGSEDIEMLEAGIFEINNYQSTSDPEHIGKILPKVFTDMEEKRTAQSDLTGIPSGYKQIDSKNGGWQPGDLIILAARPAVGKTAFTLNLADNAADQNFPAAIFNLEMTKNRIVKRLMSFNATTPLYNLLHPKSMYADDFTRLSSSLTKLSNKPIYIDDAFTLSTQELKSKLRRLKSKYGIKLAIIDYLQLMRPADKKALREQQISQISRELKGIAKELEMPIIALSQLNRQVEGRASKKPNLSDIRESGAIEQDADAIGFLYGPTPDIIAEDASMSNKVILDWQKYRDAEIFEVLFEFDKPIQKFSEVNNEPQFDNPYAGLRQPGTNFYDNPL